MREFLARCGRRAAIALFVPCLCLAQDEKPGGSEDAAAQQSEAAADEGAEGFSPPMLSTDDYRTYTFSIPAPRGLILDRLGNSLADNIVVTRLGLKLAKAPGKTPEKAVAFAAEELTRINDALGVKWWVTESGIRDHVKDRRLLPMEVSPPLTDDQIEKLKPLLEQKFVFLHAYQRSYPAGRAAAHIVGYVGENVTLGGGPIRHDELLWPTVEGRQGLEKTFDQYLTGTPGRLRIVYNHNGDEIQRMVVEPAVPGRAVVTTLSLPLQQLAEDILSEKAERGAIVAVDSGTGDIYAMASWPSFDPNLFVPAITGAEYAKLRDDPGTPLYPRAYAGAYPPGSTFKPVVALAALQTGAITPYSTLNCPIYLDINGRRFYNWNRDEAEGSLDVTRALARSCNTWFYQVGLETGARPILATASEFGFSRKPDLPLPSVAAGKLPLDTRPSPQFTANISIGQGAIDSSPLQVARAMAGIAHGRRVPEVRLVKQVQDFNNDVVEAYPPRTLTVLPYIDSTMRAIHGGMHDVVNSSWGTARSAQVSNPEIAGKTGTAQWGPESQKRNLSWFAGFAYAYNPQLAFAAVYEGKPGERVAGSRQAAPMISQFIETAYSEPTKFGLGDPDAIPRAEPVATAQ